MQLTGSIMFVHLNYRRYNTFFDILIMFKDV
jgi:hypothetical protein